MQIPEVEKIVLLILLRIKLKPLQKYVKKVGVSSSRP